MIEHFLRQYLVFEFFRAHTSFCPPFGHDLFIKNFPLPIRLVRDLVDKLEHPAFTEGDTIAGEEISNGVRESLALRVVS